MRTVHRMLRIAEVGPGDVLYDLGSGDGRVVITAARQYGAHAVGIELDPLRYVWCQFLVAILGMGDRVRIVYGDFFDIDLSDADVVTCYLLPETNVRLEPKLMHELKSGARVVSNSFIFSKLDFIQADGSARLYRQTV